MSWKLNNIRIITQSFDESNKQIIARLQPLDSGTVMQAFGYESPTYQLEGKVVGESNYNALRALVRTGVAYTLTTDLGTKTVYVSSITGKRDPTVSQTIDPTQGCYAPVWTVALELYE